MSEADIAQGAGLDLKTRVAVCLIKRGSPRTAVDVLKAALRAKSMPDEGFEVITNANWTLAYLRLAQAEYAIGDRAGAQKHAAIALRLNARLERPEPEVMEAAARVAPVAVATERKRAARDDAATIADMSSDQVHVYRRMGYPDHIESFESGGESVVTWWYGRDTYYAGYTFTNGTLTSVYNP